MNEPNKFDAAKDYDNGVRAALLHEPVFVPFDKQSKIWHAGYKFGIIVKQQMFDDKNATLIANGIEPIYAMRTM